MNKRLLMAGSVRILIRYKLRSFFMSLGIVIGVAALVVTRSMGSGAEQEMLDKMERIFSPASIIIVNSGGGMHGGFQDTGKLTIEDIESIADQLEQVVDWNPSVAVGDQEVRYKDRNRSLMIVGKSERAEFVSGRGVVEGEFFSEADALDALPPVVSHILHGHHILSTR